MAVSHVVKLARVLALLGKIGPAVDEWAARHRRLLTRIVIALLAMTAIAIAWGFVATTLSHTPEMGLPLDDSYIYLTYAKQFGRGQPFTYFPGGGYSAGSTSVLWPIVLAPFWTLGARGHALVWVSFLVCAALYVATALGVYRLVRALADELTGVLAAVLVLATAPFAFGALSGMEVAFASSLLVATLLLLIRAPRDRAPSRKLGACLAALSLSRPEAMLLAGAICVVSAASRVRARQWHAAAWWLAPLIAPVTWLVANRILAGNLFPNTGVVKSHFYLPGFDWTYWRETVLQRSGQLFRALFWEHGPFALPRVIGFLYVVGSVRIVLWARRERRWLGGAVAILGPIAMMLAVVASSGMWDVQNYRYIAAALPLVCVPAACALQPLGILPPFGRRAWQGAATLLVGVLAYVAMPGLIANMRLFAQGAMDTNTQVVAIGRYLHEHHPDATVMLHDAGAIAYYGDTRVYDMLGLVTNFQADVANNGPGSRFEFLESLPPERRPQLFAYYPGWMGTREFFSDVDALKHTSLNPQLEAGRLVGENDMQVIVPNWDHVGTGERPLNDHAGWGLVDRVDVADIASERAHRWSGRMGRRQFADRTARWSLVERETGEAGLVVDGGRTIRDGGERFTVTVDPARAARIVIRTGGQRSYPFHEAIDKPITLTLFAGSKQLGHLTVAAPNGAFLELTFTLPAKTVDTPSVELHTEATGAYRVFHWFVLQPQ
jgi:hypothetical protein